VGGERPPGWFGPLWTPSLLGTPANCPHSKHKLAGVERRPDLFRVVTKAIDMN